ncbi:unnamed protein product [Anisakis simplex]|uniref:Doublecortin domain-containing protein n=1 Tax=Anisakis simplex TaxID=6269 RepID=A0A0M3K4W1_ANISI|nr:unnamed protein product [Anisakis simplex]
MESQFMSFQRAQLEKGMSFVLELIARRFGVKPGRLCNMDGHRIRDVRDLMSRGAYVLIPAAQRFRETWYFLPDNAIDTSGDYERILERSEQRDRLIQRRERHETAIQQNQQNAQRSKSTMLIKEKKRYLNDESESNSLFTRSRTLPSPSRTRSRDRHEFVEDSRIEADQHYDRRRINRSGKVIGTIGN